MKGCLKKHQEEVLDTHRAFHPWPPGSVQWERQKTYRASTGRSVGQEGFSNQYDKTKYETTNIPYNTLSNYPYDSKEGYEERYPSHKKGLEEQVHPITDHSQKSYVQAPYSTQPTSLPSHHYPPPHTHVTTHFTQPEACLYNTSYQVSSPYPTNKYQEMTNNIEQSPYITYPQSPYLINNKNVCSQQLQPSSIIYSSIQKERTSLRRNNSPHSKIPQMRDDKNDNIIIRNTTLINEEQSFKRMNTHTYI